MVSSSTVTVSSKYQVVIPAEIRKSCNIKPGDRYVAFADGNRIELIRVRPLEEMYGIMPGLDTSVDRDEEDRI
jgi:AbrB family looped-hinge helix DNA binding protein